MTGWKSLILKGALFFSRRLAAIERRLTGSPTRQRQDVTNSSTSLDKSMRAVVITTFSPRFFSHCLPLVRNLRESGVSLPIYVVVNADTGDAFDSKLRTDFLRNLALYEASYPICLGETFGMARLWNTGIRLSGATSTVVLNDDVLVNKAMVVETLDQMFDEVERAGLLLLNNSFGHFAISRKCIQEVGWFDERFLGFGEEDGDFVWRYENKYGRLPQNLSSGGLFNQVSEVGHEQVVSPPRERHSLFNRAVVAEKYVDDVLGKSGIFGSGKRSVWVSMDTYPMDRWRSTMKPLLASNDISFIRNALRENAAWDPPQSPEDSV
jgi:hypothetical protein